MSQSDTATILIRSIELDDPQTIHTILIHSNISIQQFLYSELTTKQNTFSNISIDGLPQCHYFATHNDTISICVAYLAKRVLMWLLNESHIHNISFPTHILFTIIDVSELRVQTEQHLVQLYQHIQMTPIIQRLLRRTNIDDYEAMEYAVLRQQYKLAVCLLHTPPNMDIDDVEDVNNVKELCYRRRDTQNVGVMEILKYDISRYSYKCNKNARIDRSPLFIASGQIYVRPPTGPQVISVYNSCLILLYMSL